MRFMELFQLLFDKNILVCTTHEMSLVHNILLADKKPCFGLWYLVRWDIWYAGDQ